MIKERSLYAPYSYSKLNTNNQCPRRFKYKYVLKFPYEFISTPALQKGQEIHSLLEKHSSTQDLTNSSEGKIQKENIQIYENFIKTDIQKKYLNDDVLYSQQREIQVKLQIQDGVIFIPDENMKRKDLLFYGFIDYVNIIDGVLNIVDWKTGKYRDIKYQDFKQLMFYQIYFFIKYENINEIRIQYTYVEHCIENDLVLRREYLNVYIQELLQDVNQSDNNTFSKKISPLCNYCPFKKFCDVDLS